MPREQAVAIYLADDFRIWRYRLLKWSLVPYWQGWKGAHDADQALEASRRPDAGFRLSTMMLPALVRAYEYHQRLERHIDALRCIEAIRLYAARHEGKLPTSLEKITEVPVPIDVITGEPFTYEGGGDRATLTLTLVPPRNDPKSYCRYELTVRK